MVHKHLLEHLSILFRKVANFKIVFTMLLFTYSQWDFVIPVSLIFMGPFLRLLWLAIANINCYIIHLFNIFSEHLQYFGFADEYQLSKVGALFPLTADSLLEHLSIRQMEPQNKHTATIWHKCRELLICIELVRSRSRFVQFCMIMFCYGLHEWISVACILVGDIVWQRRNECVVAFEKTELLILLCIRKIIPEDTWLWIWRESQKLASHHTRRRWGGGGGGSWQVGW